MQQRPFYWGASEVDAVVLTVALLCTKSFDYEGLMLREIQAKRGISLQDIDKIDIIRGKLYLYDDDGATLLEEPIRDFHGAALKGCDECADFLGVAADISVGSVGSEDGYSSVLIWTDAGCCRVPARCATAGDPRARPAAGDRKARCARQVGGVQEPAADLRPGRSPLHRLRGAPARVRGDRSRTGGLRAGSLLSLGGNHDGHANSDTAGGTASPAIDSEDAARSGARDRSAARRRQASGLPIRSGSAGVTFSEEHGMDRERFGQIVAGYGNELRLWVVGERPWQQYISGLAGRVERRLSPSAKSTGNGVRPALARCPGSRRRRPGRRDDQTHLAHRRAASPLRRRCAEREGGQPRGVRAPPRPSSGPVAVLATRRFRSGRATPDPPRRRWRRHWGVSCSRTRPTRRDLHQAKAFRTIPSVSSSSRTLLPSETPHPRPLPAPRGEGRTTPRAGKLPLSHRTGEGVGGEGRWGDG